ncbi:MAG: hypothetical protein AAFX06_01700 [Planctomycetota bacterium]
MILGVVERSDLADSQRELVFDQRVLDRVLGDPMLRNVEILCNRSTAKEHLRANLSVESGGSIHRMATVFHSSKCEDATRVCNAIAKSYFQIREQNDGVYKSRAEQVLGDELTHWEKERELRREADQRTTRGITFDSLGKDIVKQYTSSKVELERLLLRSRLTNIVDAEVSQHEKRLADVRVSHATLQEYLNARTQVGSNDVETIRARAEVNVANEMVAFIESFSGSINPSNYRPSTLHLIQQADPTDVRDTSPVLQRMAWMASLGFLLPLVAVGFGKVARRTGFHNRSATTDGPPLPSLTTSRSQD